MAETILLQDRRWRRVEWLNRIPLALSAGVLAEAAWPRLAGTAARERAFATVELAAAALLVVTLVVSWRRRHRTAPATFGWIDLMAAAMLFAEWADRLAHGHKWFSPVLLTAVVTLAVGLANRPLGRIQERRRFLSLDDEGLRFRLNRFRSFRLAWSEVASIEKEGEVVRIHGHDGRVRRIPLGRLDNGEEVARALAEAAADRGVAATGATMRGSSPMGPVGPPDQRGETVRKPPGK